MTESLLLAKIIGPIMVVTAFGVFLNMKDVKKFADEFDKDPALTFMTSMFLMIFGMIMVLTHNIWEFSWVILITLIGWGTLIKGALYMLFPHLITKRAKMMSRMNVLCVGGGTIWLVAGVILVYFGYFGA